MKKILLSILSIVGISSMGYSQCAITTSPTGNCNYGFMINAFSLASVASTGNNSCGSGGYNFFSTPVRTLLMGQAYPYSATVGSGYYQMGFAIWIDLDNDGQYAASEMLVTSNQATSHSGNLTVPFTATPGTNRRMRIRAAYYTNITGSNACTNGLGYYNETEDYLVDIIAPPPCAGTPSANAVNGPTYQICPNGTAMLGLATTYTTFGNTYQWQSSTTSSVGPWTTIGGANSTQYTTPALTSNIYYSAIVTCTNGNATTLASAFQVSVAATTTNSVPYFEGFENIAFNNQLPNCSWSVTSTSNCRTYTQTLNANRQPCTGSRYASFYTYYVNATNHFYSNGIQLYSGVTYSAGLSFRTEYYGYTNVTGFSLLYGSSQSTTGLTSIVSQSPAASAVCKLMSGTFTVPSSGIYYLAIRATANSNYGTQYLSWDDLFVTAPCSINNSTLALSASQTTVCKGQAVNLTASGVDTYTWNTGANGASISDLPNNNTTYVVVGTNTLTGCTFTNSQYVVVNDSPNLVVFASNAVVCAGQPVNLTAFGATSYTWSTGSNSSFITVTPTANATYNIVGANSFGCQATAAQLITVSPSPVVSAVSSAPVSMCAGETQTLTGSGANTYQWAANTLFIVAPSALISPNVTTTYTLTGVNAQGCSGVTTITQVVDPCTGLFESTTTLSGVKVFPNPTAGFFTVELNSTFDKTIELTDVSGRLISSTTSKEGKVNMSVSHLANGIYYVKIKSNDAVEVIKVVKQ